jgi:uncharacterized protein (DUF488 family)
LNLYTIGFAGKNAEKFFGILQKYSVKTLIDIRLNNVSQLAGFTKRDDLRYFLKAICNINYVHKAEYAPTKELLNDYKKKKISWDEYEKQYKKIIEDRNILSNIDYSIFQDAALLCSEKTPEQCHRRLLAEYIAKNNKEIKLSHI